MSARGLDDLIRALCDEGVDFILVGGVAANLHGGMRATLDVDVLVRFTATNLGRLARAYARKRQSGPHRASRHPRAIAQEPRRVMATP